MKITFLDGSIKEFDNGLSAFDIAKSISSGLAKKSVYAVVNGVDFDLHSPINEDCTFELITKEDSRSLSVLWHSSAHVLAQAILKLRPNAKLTIGPATKEGFYYDVDFGGENLTEADFLKIEKEVKKIVQSNLKFERKEISKDEALVLFNGNEYKEELINNFDSNEVISTYSQGDFTDLCRGIHVPSTNFVTNFKVLSIAGAYWRGNSDNTMLQRIYAVSFFDKKDLEAHLELLKERKERDHRRIGKNMELFTTFQMVGAGLPFYLPNGDILRREIENYMYKVQTRYGYDHVTTPSIGSKKLYETSGHWDHYREDMWPAMERDNETYVLRPMNCPHHHQIFGMKRRSYRELPIRIAEFANDFRWESSGSLTGLERARVFTQNDAHIYLRIDQVKQEASNFINMFNEVLGKFNLELDYYRLSLRDPENKEKYFDDDESWDRTEELLRNTMRELGVDFIEEKDEAAFYGPKLDIQVKTAIGHEVTIGTFQLDFLAPQRFDLDYVDSDNEKQKIIVAHHAVIGSLDRFIATLIEQTKGVFPFWLAPKQVAIIPVNNEIHKDYVNEIFELFIDNDIRAFADFRDEKMGYKIREHQSSKIPFQAVIGDQELENRQITLRKYHSDENVTLSFDEVVSYLKSIKD